MYIPHNLNVEVHLGSSETGSLRASSSSVDPEHRRDEVKPHNLWIILKTFSKRRKLTTGGSKLMGKTGDRALDAAWDISCTPKHVQGHQIGHFDMEGVAQAVPAASKWCSGPQNWSVRAEALRAWTSEALEGYHNHPPPPAHKANGSSAVTKSWGVSRRWLIGKCMHSTHWPQRSPPSTETSHSPVCNQNW